MYAMIGNDGTRPVVWGIGANGAEAEANARLWIGEAAAAELAAMTTVTITDEQADKVRVGVVGCAELGIR